MAFPKKDAEVDIILQIWNERLEERTAQFGLTPEIVKQVKTDSIVHHHTIVCASLLEQDRAEFYAYKENSANGDPKGTSAPFPTISLPALPATDLPPKPGIIPRNTELYNFLKNHPNRTDEALADLGITTTRTAPVSPDNLKLTIGGKAMANDHVELTFNKQRQSAVRFQMRRHGGDWNNLSDPTTSPYIDKTPSVDGKPEKREYRGIYIDKNEPVGQYSDIITVYTSP